MRAFFLIFVFFAGLLAVSWLPPYAWAEEPPRIVSPGAKRVSLTIYPDNLALITEEREIDLPAGQSKIVFEGVNEKMIPASVLLREFTGFMLERNFDAELLGKATLFERSIGQTVTLTHTDLKNGKARSEPATIIAAAPDTGVVFQTKTGIEVYQCSGLGETTLFDALPEGLNTVPELSILVRTKTPGPQTVVISYLAEGFDWAADYRLEVKSAETKAHAGRFSGWLTFSNQTGQSFKDAPVAIIAGTLNRSDKTYAPLLPQKHLSAHCWPIQSTQTPIPFRLSIKPTGEILHRIVQPRPDMVYSKDDTHMLETVEFQAAYAPTPPEEENLSEYKLYRMSEPLTLASYQTKQIRFIDKKDAVITPIYTFEIQYNQLEEGGIMQAVIEYRLDNSRDGKIAKALPRGTYRVFSATEANNEIYLGEDGLEDKAIGLPVKIKVGDAFNVQMKTRVLKADSYKDKSHIRKRLKVEHVFYNAHNTPVTIEFKPDRRWQWMFYEIINPSFEPDKDEELKWTFTLEAQHSKVLTYSALEPN